MRSEFHKEPPPDLEFPSFEVTYYDKPASAGITVKTTDARRRRWPDSSQSFHNDGSISGLKPSSEDTQHQWRQKLGELLTDKFLLVDEHLSGMICTLLFFLSQSNSSPLVCSTVHLRPMAGRRCFLIDFPSDYKLFTHTKDGRIDHYLIGTPILSCLLPWVSTLFLPRIRIENCQFLQVASGVLSSRALAYDGGGGEL